MSSRIMSYNNKNEQQQQQQLPINTNNAYNLPKDVLKLDLHGYTKSEGICRTTEFLDRASSRQSSNNGGGKAWVLIVTGSGSHSSQTQGPVLRGAIENLLIKRNIEYYPMKGNGSFLVNALSGFVLYEPEQPRDTKVIISANANNAKNNRGSASYSSAVASMAAIKPLSLTQQIDNSSNNNVALKKAYQKQCKEEIAYQRAMSESLADPTYKAEKQDEELLERAFNLSLLDKRREIQEEQNIQQIIENSRRESRIQAMAELDEIQKVAELSKKEFEQAMAELDEIQKVAELSKKEFDNHNNAHNNNDIRESRIQAMIDEEEEEEEVDDEIQKVVELSKIEFDDTDAQNNNDMNNNNNNDMMNDPDACMLRAIELSRKVTNRVDDEMLSVLEQSIIEHQQYQDDDEELLLKVLEQSVAEF